VAIPTLTACSQYRYVLLTNTEPRSADLAVADYERC
jgi:hypothetical protein